VRNAPVFFFVLILATSAPAGAADVAGVRLPDTMDVGGRPLSLNGAAVLKKMVFKVYVVALYLPAPARDAEAAVTPDEPKGFVMHFLRPVTKKQLVDALVRGFASNGGEHAKRAEADIARLLQVVKDMEAGDRLTFTYEPGKGATVSMTDGTTASFAGKDFADAFLLLYVGPSPPREELKRKLLGQG